MPISEGKIKTEKDLPGIVTWASIAEERLDEQSMKFLYFTPLFTQPPRRHHGASGMAQHNEQTPQTPWFIHKRHGRFDSFSTDHHQKGQTFMSDLNNPPQD